MRSFTLPSYSSSRHQATIEPSTLGVVVGVRPILASRRVNVQSFFRTPHFSRETTGGTTSINDSSNPTPAVIQLNGVELEGAMRLEMARCGG